MAPLMDRYPSVSDLEARAKRRIPHFAWEYLASGTGSDSAVRRNLEAVERVELRPQFLKGPLTPELSTTLFGQKYAAPFGIAPVGLTGLIWPGSDLALAETAREHQIPYVMSTVATGRMEETGPIAGEMSWFQLYPPRDDSIRDDLLRRAAEAGFKTLVVTADVPAGSRRERQRKAHIRVPPQIGPRLVWQSLIHPAWSMAILRNGLPTFRVLEPYVDAATMRNTAGFVGARLGGSFSYDYLEAVRALWDGPIVVKGILDPDDAQRCVDSGADGIQVSNHGGRQLDAVIPSIEALPTIVERVGGPDGVPVIFDSGVRDGVDIARAVALGANFVFCGRAFFFGLGALGAPGASHVADILTEGLTSAMAQTGCQTLDELPSRLA